MKKSDYVDIILETGAVAEGRDQPERGTISRLISMSLNTIFFEIFRAEPSFINEYVQTFKVTPVKYDDDISIITIPVSTLQLPVIGNGIKIYSQTDPELLFVPIRKDEHYLTEDINQIDGVHEFEVLGSKIRVYGLTHISELLLDVVPGFETLDDDAEFHLPSGSDVNLVQTVREMLGVVQPRPIISYRTPSQ